MALVDQEVVSLVAPALGDSVGVSHLGNARTVTQYNAFTVNCLNGTGVDNAALDGIDSRIRPVLAARHS